MDGYTLGTVTIVKTMTDDDVIVTVDAETPDGNDLPLVDALGMIELAKDSLLHAPDEDDDE